MEKKTLRLSVGSRGTRLESQRPQRNRMGRNATEVVVESAPRRRVVKALQRPQTTVEAAPAATAAKAKLSDREIERRSRALLKEHVRTEEQRQAAELADRQLRQEQARADALAKEEAEARQVAERLKEDALQADRQAAEGKRQDEAAVQEAQRDAAEPAAKQAPAAKVGGSAGETKESKPSAGPRKSDRKRGRDREEPRHAGRVSPERRRRGKLTVSRALNDEERQRSHAAYLRSQERKKRKAMGAVQVREKVVREVQLPESIVVQELANRMAERVSDVVKTLMKNGVMVTQNQSIDADTAELTIAEFGHTAVRVSDADVEEVIASSDDKPEDLSERPPVVTVMGHVDHGKTSLLDSIRKTSVASGEAGGITQHIGAYQVRTDSGALLSFIDTPGHEAFAAMRARGAQVTDIVVLVVAADDSVMPQTVEAINHAKAAEVPIIVAINKCDKSGADPDTVRNQLLRHGIIVEHRSGDVIDVEVSALTGQGIGTLLEMIGIQAEVLELKANPNRSAVGAVIESRLDVGRGPVATILVRTGTLRKGDVFVVGEQWGKVRALVDHEGARVAEAGPAMPVEVLGLNGTPNAGDILNVVETESQAREISEFRQRLSRGKRAAAGATASMEQFLRIKDGMKTDVASDLKLVVKADVQGSSEAVTQAVERIGNDEVKVRVLHSGVGAITETDVGLAEASNALIVGFNVRANAAARKSAQDRVDIRYYSVIYSLVDDIRSIASGLLPMEIKESFLGNAEILEVFRIPGVGPVAGCKVTEGVVKRAAGIRLLRDSVVVHEGRLKTLKRFTSEVAEVQSGLECGMAFENYSNIRQGDAIEVFEREEIQRSL